MKVLVDSNILLRLQDNQHSQYPLVIQSLMALRQRKDQLVIVPQIAVEFWRVCTGPIGNQPGGNAFGFDPAEADRRLKLVEQAFPMLPEHPGAYAEWRKLVVSSGLIGKRVFDARIASLMLAHGLNHILTFNTKDFRRFPGITPIDPVTLAG